MDRDLYIPIGVLRRLSEDPTIPLSDDERLSIAVAIDGSTRVHLFRESFWTDRRVAPGAAVAGEMICYTNQPSDPWRLRYLASVIPAAVAFNVNVGNITSIMSLLPKWSVSSSDRVIDFGYIMCFIDIVQVANAAVCSHNKNAKQKFCDIVLKSIGNGNGVSQMCVELARGLSSEFRSDE